jgi:predicted DNA-binding protein (UPF0251 family)
VVNLFKPAGVPACELETQVLSIDEVEALRLVDAEGLDQQAAAERMKVSRATVGRILEGVHRKVALALVHGHALLIEEGAAAVEFYGGCRGFRHGGEPCGNRKGQD